MANKEKGKQNQQKTEDSTTPNKVKFDYPPTPVNKWNASAVKYALDDTLKKIAKDEFGFVENFTLMDQRLAICTIACAFSAFALIYDYLFPFPASRFTLAMCAICYFVMMGVLTLFTMYKENNIIMVALEKDEAGVGPDDIWTYHTTMSKFNEVYGLKIAFKDGETAQTRNAELERSVSTWYDGEGRIVNDKFFVDVKNLHMDISKSKKDL